VFSGVRHGSERSSDVVLSCVIVTFTAANLVVLDANLSSLDEPCLSHLEGKNTTSNQ
jgi:hypothetical protein